MPKFIYQPEGADPRSWDIELRKMSSKDGVIIERLTGMKWAEWSDAIFDSSMIALQGLLFVLLRRDNPALQWDQIEFCIDDLAWELSDAERLEKLRQLARLERSGKRVEAREQLMLAALRESIPAPEQETVDRELDEEFGAAGEATDPTSPPSVPESGPAPGSPETQQQI